MVSDAPGVPQSHKERVTESREELRDTGLQFRRLTPIHSVTLMVKQV